MKLHKCYDVVVIGGGAAGIAAAIGAAKTGAKTMLIERSGCFGGQATNANVASYCGFFTHEKKPRQVVKGIGQEVLDGLADLGGYSGCSFSGVGNAIIPFDEELLKVALDNLMRKYALDVLLHCTLVRAETAPDEKKIHAVVCVDDENEYTFEAAAFVDATGDANLAHLAGAATRYGDGKGGGYFSTKVMRIDCVAPETNLSPKVMEPILHKAKADGYNLITKESGIIFRTEPDMIYAILPSTAVPSLDATALTECEMQTRAQCQQYIQVFRKYVPGMENARLLSTGNTLGLRDTRHMIGKETLMEQDVLSARKRPDRIARGAWPCEMHNDIRKMGEYLWIENDDYYDISLGILESATVKNLWGAGRCVSADPIAFASVRVMGIGFATGHAAGVAAALTATGKDAAVPAVQQELQQQGAEIFSTPN